MDMEGHIVAKATQQGIPPEKYQEIHNAQENSLYFREEAKTVLKFILDDTHDKETMNISLDIFLDKIIKTVKYQVVAELMSENWRIS